MKLTDKMIEKLNLQLDEEGSCLKYVKFDEDGIVTSYRITVIDKFISKKRNNYVIPNITKEFEDFVREFFLANYKVEQTGFSNSVVNLMAWK